MSKIDPDWTAPREGHDWQDNDLLLVVAWLKSFVPANQMAQRLDAAKQHLTEAWKSIREGKSATLFDPEDAAAWYILQAETFATDRTYWTPEGVMRIVPFLTRLGKELPLLMTVKGVEERGERLMLAERKQPDSGLFELLVALAYRRGGWNSVEFVPETPGRGRTPDIRVFQRSKRWAVECKRLRPSPYAAREQLRGEELAAPIHTLSLETNESVIVEVKYKVELEHVPNDYLVPHVQAAIRARSFDPWDDGIATGRVRPVDWELIHKVLAKDYVYFGSSRMIELLVGYYVHEAGHSMAAKWRPAADRATFADAVYQASVVTWRSFSDAAIGKKARHFKSLLGDAEGQLPADRPGVIHVGIESYAGSDVDFHRHVANSLEARFFKPKNSRLRWVYGNYFVPEATTRRDESWAMTETMVPYKIGAHKTRWPLPDHMLVSPEGVGRRGVHWDGEED